MNKILHFTLLSLVAIILSGCASGATKEGMMYLKPESRLSDFDTSFNKHVGVQSVEGGKETNPMWRSQISNDDFSAAVKESLNSHGLFSESGRYLLRIIIQDVNQPIFGLDMTVSTTVNYVLFDTQQNRTVLNKTITAKYTEKFSAAFIAIKRLRLANEGSAKSNIKALVESLAELKISAQQVSIQN